MAPALSCSNVSLVAIYTGAYTYSMQQLAVRASHRSRTAARAHLEDKEFTNIGKSTRLQQLLGQRHRTRHTCRRWVDGHVVSGVIQELGTSVALNIVTVIVTPAQLHIDPVLVAGLLVKHVILVCHEGGLGHGPLVGSKQQDVGTGGVHLVRFPGVDGLLLDSLNLQRIQFLVKHLTPAQDSTGRSAGTLLR